MKRVRRKLDEWATAFVRRLIRPADEKSRLRTRIRRRIAELGRTYEDGNSDIIGYTYHPIPFPGYEDVKTHRDECVSRLGAIMSVLQVRPGDRILDIGANVGYFSFSLARQGAIVESYESHSACFEIGAALSLLHGTDVLYINKPMSKSALPYLGTHYRAALLLSIFHWIVKQDGIEAATEVLREIARRCDAVFFEVPNDPCDAMYRHELFSSRERTEAYLREALPSARIEAIMEDPRWAGRVLYHIVPGQADAV